MVKIHVKRVAQWFLLIAVLGLLLLTLSDLSDLRPKHVTNDSVQTKEMHHSDPTLLIDDSLARALRHKGRVLCWIPSTQKQLRAKVKAVNDTWATRCDGHVFFIEGPWSEENPRPPDVVSLDVPPGYYNLTTKVVTVMLYLYRYHLNDYDWFVKGDDDAYLIVENLRYLLSRYDASSPVYLGHLYKRHHPRGYMSGGASYVLSRQALKTMVEQGYKKKRCATKGSYEDLEVAKCLHAVGVASHNTRDRFHRDTFHPLRPSTHIAGPIPDNQKPQDYFPMVAGPECCSQLTISFHKVDPTLMRIMDQLVYRTSVYGREPDMAALQTLITPKEHPPLQ